MTRSAKGLTISESPTKWETSARSFVYVDEHDRIWAHDEAGNSFILEATEEGSKSWDFKTWKRPFPDIVLKRVSSINK
jgi:hypothetical protein